MEAVATSPAEAARPAWEGHPLARAIRHFTGGMGAITGFLTPGAAAVILTTLEVQQRDAIVGPVAEIGTYHGKTFVGLALALRDDEHILGVDLFIHQDQDFEATLREHCRSHGVAAERIRLHRGSSTALAPGTWRAMLGAPARFVHVDGEHTRAAILHDLALAASHLTPGGAILVDDVLHPWFPDVTLGVIDFLGGHPELRAVALIDRQGPLLRGGPKLLIAGIEDEARYRAAIAACLGGSIVKEASLGSSRPLILGFDEGARKRLLPIA